ncbi:MAG: MFS transporter [Chloroflexota bacterium]|nr:MFS transporter [Chloroflexota bacterium]
MLKHIGLNRNLATLSGTIFINLFVSYLWYPLLPLHLRALGASDWEIGVSFTVMGIAHAIFAVFGGALADRYGRRLVTAAPTFLMAPLYIAAGLANNWLIVIAMLVGTNILGAVQWPAMSALITESSDDARVARAFSFTESGVLIGLIAGPIAGAALLTTLSISAMIVLYGVVLIFTSGMRAWGLTEPARRTAGSAMPRLRTAIDPSVRWFIAGGTCIAIAFAISFGPYFAILARDAWHNGEGEINLLWAAGSLASLLGILFGRLSDHWGARRVLMLSALAYGVSTIAWGIAPTWEWGLAPLLIAFGFSEAVFIAQQTLQAEITSRETRSSMIGIIVTTTGLLGGLGPTLGAWLITLGGNAAPFVAAGLVSLLAILAIWQVRGNVASVAHVVSAQAE